MIFHAQAYNRLGWRLCSTRESNGKQPYPTNWNQNPRDPSHWEQHPRDGIGLIHSLSGTCSIDIDNLEHARTALHACGVDLDELLSSGVQIVSGTPNSAKLIYRVPAGVELKRVAAAWPKRDSDSKPITVIEFRAGANQDVLPPTIHPQNSVPYKWVGDYQNIPELPAALLGLWQNWGLTKQAVLDACPWHVETPIEAPVRTYSARGGASVIDAFNAQVDPRSLLVRAGYVQGGRRFLFSGSSTGTPGVVVFEDGPKTLVYSHHGADPLADGHAHDAFSVFTILEHAGNVIESVKEAAGLLGMDNGPDPAADALAEQIIKNTRPPAPVEQLQQPPRELQATNPGAIPVAALNDACAWIADQLHAAKSDAVIQSVLSLAGALASRRYVCPDGQPVTMFFGIVDSSVAALRPLKPLCYELASAAGERQMIRGTRIPSAGVLYSALLRHPRVYWYTDEYGQSVRTAKHQQSGATESALAVVHEAYTGQTIFIDPDTAARSGRERPIEECNIYAPSVTLCALLSEDQISALGQRTEYGRGTLQQMMIVPAGDALEHKSSPGAEPPDSLVGTAELLAPPEGVGGICEEAFIQPTQTVVQWGAGAADELVSLRERLTQFMSDPARANWRGIAHGYTQSALRLGCVLAAWQNPAHPVLTRETLRWAAAWVERCLVLTMPLIEKISGDTDEPDLMERVLHAASKIDGPFTMRDIARRCRPFLRLSVAQREELIAALVEDGQLQELQEGRATKYVAA